VLEGHQGKDDGVLTAIFCTVVIVLQWKGLRCCDHVVRKNENDWVKSWLNHDTEAVKHRGWPVTDEDLRCLHLNEEEAVVCSKCRPVEGNQTDNGSRE